MAFLLKFLVPFALLFSSTSFGQAKNHERYWPARILDVQQKGARVTVSYLKPCGADYFATFMKPGGSSAKITAQIGVILIRRDARCTGISKMQTVQHKMIKPGITLQADRSSFHFTSKSRFLESTSVASQLFGKGKSRRIQVVYVKECTKPNLFIFRESGSRVEIGLSQIGKKRKPGTKCSDTKLQTIEVPLLKTSRIAEIDELKLGEKPHSLAELDMEVRPVEKVLRHKKNGLRLSYKRQCNEVGIGITLTEPRRTDQGRSFVKAGVLVAKMPVSCSTPSKLATISNEKINIPQNVQVRRSLPYGSRKDVQIEPVFEFARKKTVGADKLKFTEVSSCKKTLAAVYALDPYKKLSVGLLRIEPQKAGCKRRYRKSQFHQMLQFTKKDKGFYPLKIVSKTRQI